MSVTEPEPVPLVAQDRRPVLPLSSPPSAGLPVLRLLPAPDSEPPYDDELPGRPDLRLVDAPLLDLRALRRPPLRLLPAAPPVLVPLPAPPVPGEEDGPVRTPLAALPDPRPFAHALVQRLLEVRAGVRPVAQLQRDTTFELFLHLEQLLGQRPRSTGPRPDRRSIRGLHVQARPEGVAEVCATVLSGPRATALALRLEGLDGSWRCTELVGL